MGFLAGTRPNAGPTISLQHPKMILPLARPQRQHQCQLHLATPLWVQIILLTRRRPGIHRWQTCFQVTQSLPQTPGTYICHRHCHRILRSTCPRGAMDIISSTTLVMPASKPAQVSLPNQCNT